MVHQQASLHQLHYTHPSQQLDKAFPCLHDVTCSIWLYVHIEIISMCIKHAMVANCAHITRKYKQVKVYLAIHDRLGQYTTLWSKHERASRVASCQSFISALPGNNVQTMHICSLAEVVTFYCLCMNEKA